MKQAGRNKVWREKMAGRKNEREVERDGGETKETMEGMKEQQGNFKSTVCCEQYGGTCLIIILILKPC